MIQHPAEYAGLGNFVWFFGVVEDNVDPLFLGRVKVRCFGWHDANKGQVPTDALPWAQIMMPSTSASVSGVGTSPTGIATGSWVIGFFLDGNRCQQPMILGTFHGIPQAMAVANQGFNDPTGQFPRTVDEPDTTRLARTETDAATHAMMMSKTSSLLKGVATAAACQISPPSVESPAAAAATTWNEPSPRGGQSIYPHNKVIETVRGHVTEFDDSPDCARIHEFHAAGTFREIQNTGTRITKVIADDYEIVAGHKHVYVAGDCDLTIKGTVRIRIDGDLIEEVTGNHFVTIHGSRYTKIDGDDAKTVSGIESVQVDQKSYHATSLDRGQTVGGQTTITSTGSMSISSDGSASVTAAGAASITSSGAFSLSATGAIDLVSSSSVLIDGPTVNINP
jgi:hypothetical protein